MIEKNQNPLKITNKIPVVIIFAPTASGKTALTRELFSRSGSHFILNAEIISADSQAVYKGMDIGTAKPDAALCSQIPHHMIDLVTPEKQFSVSEFITEADTLCDEIFRKGKVPVICGGTGFYIRSFMYGLPQTPESDETIRKQLKTRIAKEGNEALYAELQKIDPISASVININDEYRICRALEVYYTTGKTRSSYKIEPKLRDIYDFTFLVLEPPRSILYQRIKNRVDLMFEMGLEKEINQLKAAGYTKETPGMKAIGYSEWFDEEYNGDSEKIKEAIKHHSCRYAKKQYTYIRDIPGSIVIPFNGDREEISLVAEKIRTSLQEKFEL